jgi:hypothetical protein
VIKTVALGVVCLAGLGAIAAAAKKTTPPASPEVVMPIASGNKADRLPIRVDDTLTEADRVHAAYVPPADRDQIVRPQSSSPQAAGKPRPKIISRHWHDPHALKSRAAKKGAIKAKLLKKRATDAPSKQVSDGRECPSSGLQTLLRKLTLLPQCDS